MLSHVVYPARNPPAPSGPGVPSGRKCRRCGSEIMGDASQCWQWDDESRRYLCVCPECRSAAG